MDINWITTAADCIKYHRKQSGLSQKKLATLAGVGKTAIFDIEHGKATVRLETFIKVCIALNITLSLDGPLMEQFHAQG